MAHLLKRLELNGFKSFASKTTLEFPKGITAIVGPNGSGKSNVIDAIRWLLGERDAKNLRGGKGEDLIFAGSVKRARMGQAQASLHFENHKHFFPVDVAEVEVLRQVNRDGTNQYFLNKAEVRLKDLIDFFAQARLGSRGLTVITQGNSDLFIRVTPKERRAMIEEILGLREFQIKRADAERRLKNTGINLDKTHALVDEILPHLRSLKRQTNRWEKRSVIQEELIQLENQYFGSQWRELKEKSEVLKRDLAEKEKSHHTLKVAHTEAQTGLEKLESNAPREREELKELKAHSQTLYGKRNDLEKRFARLEAELEIHEKTGAASVAVPAGKLLELVHDVKSRLESALKGDSYDLPLIIKEIVDDIENALKGGGSTGLTTSEAKAPEKKADTGIEKEFKVIADDIEAIGK
ncbi:MAG: AAA family ATPase, partial [bacterium]|nr:AAA family ATPase [bacterium]